MEKKITKLCVITSGYPSKKNSYYPFVGQLCEEFSRQDIAVTVICPQSILSVLKHKGNFRKIHCVEDGNNLVDVYRPYYVTLPYRYKKINNFLFRLCVKAMIRKLGTDFDAFYSHFWQPGYNTYKCIQSTNKPLFVATGESEISKMYEQRTDDSKFSQYLKGVIAVSTKNKQDSIRLGLTSDDYCRVFPNSIDNKLFYQRDKKAVRNKLGISDDLFIVAFVGWFIDRKGSKRVSQAIDRISENNVYSFFIGAGLEEPSCKNIIFKGKLPHEKIPDYLSAADVFVLPTLNEGCCNAIIEAMACGLPIISSNLKFNWDVLDESNSIMVDPNNVDEIYDAIVKLRDDDGLRNHLSEGAMQRAKSLTLSQRATSIIEFMNSQINNRNENTNI